MTQEPQHHPRRRRERAQKPSIDPELAAQIATHVPSVVRYGAMVVVAQSLVMFGYAIWLIVKNLSGNAASTLESDSAAADFVGIGTAIFLMIIFGFVGTLGARTALGRPTGSGAIVLTEMIFLGVALYMFRGGAIVLGVVTAVSAVVALLGVFHPASARYWEARYEVRRKGA